MQKIVQGTCEFQSKVFCNQRELFLKLAKGQSPDALFITCADSRINPNLITQTEPGELFILRNAGNIVPPYGACKGGEEATIEFAVVGLGVEDVIVCGHSLCGAMKGLLNQDLLKDLPAMSAWLTHAEATRRIVAEKHRDCPETKLLDAAIEENVLVQIENLRTHPCVAARLAQGKLKLHAWVYKIETGEVLVHHPDKGQFLPLVNTDAPPAQRSWSTTQPAQDRQDSKVLAPKQQA